jgi:hypothetical protein
MFRLISGECPIDEFPESLGVPAICRSESFDWTSSLPFPNAEFVNRCPTLLINPRKSHHLSATGYLQHLPEIAMSVDTEGSVRSHIYHY